MREPGLVFAAADVTASGSQRPRGRGRSRWLRAAGLAAEWQELSSTPGDPRLCWGGGVWDQAPRAGWHCARVSRRLVRDGMALAERGTPGRTRSRVRFSGGNLAVPCAGRSVPPTGEELQAAQEPWGQRKGWRRQFR